MKKKRTFSLLEVMVAIAICISFAGAIGWKMHGMIEKKRFSSSVQRVESRLQTLRRLAMNCQADFEAELTVEKEGTFLNWRCAEGVDVKGLSKLSLGPIELYLNGEKLEKFSFSFTATGDILPERRIEMRKGTQVHEIDCFSLFSVQEGKKAGPMHPDDW